MTRRLAVKISGVRGLDNLKLNDKGVKEQCSVN
mgnify:CR=1 FL=1